MWSKEAIRAFVSRTPVIVGAASVASCALGATTAHLMTKKQLEKKYAAQAEKEIEEARRFYTRIDEKPAAPEELLTEDMLAKGKKLTEELLDKATKEAVSNILTDYRTISAEEKPEIRNVFKEASDVKGVNEAVAEARRTEGKPYVISQEEFFQNHGEYTQVTLTYFEGDDILVDERDSPVEDIEGTVAEENLEKFGEGSNDGNMVHVRNENLEIDFEIICNHGKFAEEVLGFVEHSQPLRKFREYDD